MMKRLNNLLEAFSRDLVDRMEERQDNFLVAILPVVSVVLAFIVGGLLLLLLKFNPITVYSKMIGQAFSDPFSIARIFVKATPLIFTALAFGFTFNGFLFNIGAQGQFYVGALMAVFISLTLGGTLHPAVLLPIVFLGSGAAGGLWASFAGWAKSRFNTNEFLITMLSTYVATSVINYFISGPLQEPKGEYPQTAQIPDSATIPTIGATDLHYGFFVAVLVALAAYFILHNTSLGFKIRHVGINTESSRYGGINVKRVYVISFFLAGAFAGFAGFTQINGVQHMAIQGFASRIGAEGIGIAMLGNANPIGIIFGSLLFGMIKVGGIAISRSTEVPSSIISVLEGFTVLFVVISYYFQEKLSRFLKRDEEE